MAEYAYTLFVAPGETREKADRYEASTTPSGKGSPGEKLLTQISGPARDFGGWVGNRAEYLRHFKGWVYASCDFIGRQCAKHCPVAVYSRDGAEKETYGVEKTKAMRSGGSFTPRRWVPSHIRLKSAGVQRVGANEEMEYVPPSEPLAQLLKDPNKPELAFNVRYLFMVFYLLTGVAYLLKVRDAQGRVRELWSLPSHWVREQCLPNSSRLVDQYVVTGGGRPIYVKPEDMIVMRKPGVNGPLSTQSPVEAAAFEVDTLEQIQVVMWRMLQNGADVGGVVELPAGENVSPQALDRLYESVRAYYSGSWNAGKPLVIAGKFVHPPAERELQYLKSMEFCRDNVFAMYGLDSGVMGFSKDQTYAAAIDNQNRLWMNVIEPLLALEGQVLTEQLASEFDDSITIIYPNNAPVSPEDFRENFKVCASVYGASQNDARTRLMGWDPWEGEEFDVPLVPMNLMPMTPERLATWDEEPAGTMGTQGEPGSTGAADESNEEDQSYADYFSPQDDPTDRIKAFSESKVHRGQPENAGQFGPGGGKKAPAKKTAGKPAVVAGPKPKLQTEAAAHVGGKIKPTKQRAFAGESAPSETKISKQLAGAIGEEVVIAVLKSRGHDDAGSLSSYMHSERNNLPADLIHDHQIIEVKTGQASNGPDARKWRLTIGEPGEKEKEWLKKATPEEKAIHNEKKMALIHERKKKELAKVAKQLGYKIDGKTMTVIINPATKTADVYEFDGFHNLIGWNSTAAQKGYVGSYRYGGG